MASVNFIVKGKRNPSSIYLQFRDSKKNTPDGISIWRKTGKVVNPKDWNFDKKMPYGRNSDLKNLATDLRELAGEIIKSYNNTSASELNAEWLQKRIDIFNDVYSPEDEPSEILTDSIQFVIDTANIRENSKGGMGLSKSRINSYKTLLKLIKEFQGKKKFLVVDVDIKFGKSLMNWMLNERNYSESYAKKKIDDLKTVCAEAEINGVTISSQLRKVKGGKTKNDFILYLAPDELEKIKKLTLENESLNNARKWLLIGCEIGQRGGDLLDITEKNFVVRNGLDLIELTQQKTGKKVIIPVLPPTKEILQEGLPYKISLQKFNYYIKLVCRKAGIDQMIPGNKIEMVDKEGNVIPKDKKGKRKEKGEKRNVAGTYPKYELIGSHVCRRSFASNLYGKLPTPLIMQITAHSTEKMLLYYIGKSSMDYAQQISDWYTLQAQKDKREAQMDVIKNASNQ